MNRRHYSLRVLCAIPFLLIGAVASIVAQIADIVLHKLVPELSDL